MLTQEEENFLKYWEMNRERRKKVLWQFLLGIPAGLLFIVPMILSLASRWDKRADLLANRPDTSNPTILLIAFLLIGGFIAIFSKRLSWERNEARYQELKARKSAENKG